MRRHRIARLVAAAAIAASPGTAPANAVTPPAIDEDRLPPSAPAAPQYPAVQRAACTVPVLASGRTATQLDGLDLAAAWAFSRGAGQRVAVIDTGVAAHRQLPGLIGGGDYVSTGDGTRDCDGHGTLVAGIIAATTRSTPSADMVADWFSGVAPLATVIGIRQSSQRFGAAGDLDGVGDVDTLAKAVRTAADSGASVINISAVACRSAATGLDDRALGAALAYAVHVRRSVIVAAAGNIDHDCVAGQTTIVSPAWYDEYVLTVGSVDTHGAASAFTLPSAWVDVAAPGEAVVSLSTVGDALADSLDGAALSGTSFAAPVVSGLAALIRSRFPDWTPRQVMDRIISTAHHPPGGRDDFVGAGVIDPVAALSSDSPIPASSTPAPPPSGPAPTPGSAPAQQRPEPSVSPGPNAAASTGLRTAITGTAVLVIVLLASSGARMVLNRRQRHGPTEPALD